jgi:hypothetical protein
MSFSLIESKVRPEYYKNQTTLSHKYTGISPATYFRFLLDLDVKNFYSNNNCLMFNFKICYF